MVSKSTEFCIKNSPCNDRSLGMRCSIAVLGNGVHNKGFALVISLTLMSFVLTLLLSLSLLVQVELQSAQISMKRLVAKENARLGLMLAMGDLQRYAGADERVTFSSTAYSKDEEIVANPNWTGVVDTRFPTGEIGEIKWLVSSDKLTPELPTEKLNNTNSRVLIGVNNSEVDTEVRVPLKNIETNANKYAFWISDDSTKASLATRPDYDGQSEEWLSTNFNENEVKRLGQIIPKRSGIEVLFSPTQENTDAKEILNQISKVTSAGQVPMMNGWNFTNYDHYIHSLTDRSYGLLASTTGTGLRNDLSLRPEAMPIPGAFSLIENYESYMEQPLDIPDSSKPYMPWADDLRRRYYITAPSSISDGKISDGISPVLTDFKLIMGVHESQSNVVSRTAGSISPITFDDEIVIRLSLYAELWNPYTSALVPENLVLQIKNLPTIQVGLKTSLWGPPVGVQTIDLNQVLSNGSAGSDGYYVELPFTDQYYSNHDDFSWLPGRIYSWTGQNNYSGSFWTKNSLLGKFYDRSLSSRVWYAGTGMRLASNIRYLEISGPETNLTVSLLTKKGSDLSDGDPLFVVDGINFDPFNVAPKTTSYKDYTFGFRIMRDESGFAVTSGDLAWNKSNWLRTQDPRAYNPTFDPEGNRVGALIASEGLDPANIKTTGVKNENFLFDRTAGGSGLRPSEDVPLFELFRQRPLSVGELQHLKIADRRSFSIGNSWGSENGNRYNRIFDEAFFSGLKEDDFEPAFKEGEALPNHRLRSITEITGDPMPALSELVSSSNNTSERLYVDGAFNINSTSSSAWAATLGSIQLPDWEIANINDSNGDLITSEPRRSVSLGHSLLRFPQSAQEVYHTGEKKNTVSPPTEYFRVGAKDSKSTVDPMPYAKLGVQIAKRVSDRIKLFGPFISIESFLSPVEDAAFAHPKDPGRYLSVVEQAIIDVPEINQVDGEEIWYHTSSFLSQADVMTALAPISTVRGDTFTIRALGEAALDISGDSVATALCEARVQRIPITVDPNDSLRTPEPDGYGRRFIFSSIQWVND